MRRWRFADWPLRVKFAVLLLVASAAPLAIEAAVIYRSAREMIRDQAANLLRARAEELAGTLDVFHRAHQAVAYRTARIPAVVEYCTSPSPARARAAEAVLQVFARSDPNFRGLAIFDGDGTIVVGTEPPLLGNHYGFRKYFQDAQRGIPNTSNLYIAVPEVGSVPSIAYAHPVKDARGRVVGVLALYVRGRAFWEAVRAADGRAGDGSFSVVFDDHGIRIAHSARQAEVFRPGGPLDAGTIDALVAENRFGEKTREMLSNPLPVPAQFDAARGGVVADTFRGHSPGNGQWNLVAAKRLQTVPWTLFYAVPEPSLYSHVGELFQGAAAASVALLVLALGAGLALAVRIRRPLERLSTAAEALGAGDLAARVHIAGTDELGRLAARFNAMAEAIAGSQEKLVVAVRERTAELTMAGEELSRQKAILESVLHSIGDGVIVADASGRFLVFNPAAERVLGVGAIDAPTDEWAERYGVFAPDRLTRVPTEQLPLVKAIRGMDTDNVELFIRNARAPDGVLISLTGRPLRDAAGALCGGVVVFRDVTKQKAVEEEIRSLNQQLSARNVELTAQAEELKAQGHELQAQQAELLRKNREVEEATRAKSAFLANMSHELRTPLNAVIGFSEILHSDAADRLTAKERKYLDEIMSGGRHLLALINDILDLSKVEAGRIELSVEPVDAAQAVREACSAVEALAGRKRIELRRRAVNGVRVRADRGRLHQILLNLLSNAVKFSPEDSVVEVDTEEILGREMLRFRVRDRGPGMDRALQAKLFQPFVQGDSSLVRKHQGTGLGLAITRRLVEEHGGTIELESAPGQGSTFSFTLRAWQTAGRHAAAPVADARPPSVVATAPLILVLEKELAAARLVRGHLEDAGYRVTEARDAREAVAAATSSPPSAILVDVADTDEAFLLVQELRAAEATRHIPVLMQSIVPHPLRGHAFGSVDCLVKPVDPVRLLARLKELVPPVEGPPRLLLVDDDPRVGRLLRGMLEREGYSVDVAETGRTGLRSARESAPDLIIVDIGLPDISGFEVIDGLAADERTRSRPVIVLTAKDLTSEERRLLRDRAQAVAEKGDLSREALLALVRRATCSPVSSTARAQVLVVEDHDVNRELTRTLVERRGFDVLLAHDGKEGLALARQHRPALVLMDLAMPEMDGWAALRALRADEALAGIPVVALTAHAMRGVEVQAREAGFDDYLTKPIEAGALDRILSLAHRGAASRPRQTTPA
jgi:PAS domain S-box-containing protein